jgi:hypothetical protein
MTRPTLTITHKDGSSDITHAEPLPAAASPIDPAHELACRRKHDEALRELAAEYFRLCTEEEEQKQALKLTREAKEEVGARLASRSAGPVDMQQTIPLGR